MSKSSGGWPDFHIAGAFADASGPDDGRRTKPAPKPRPFSLRLTAEERAQLEAEAGPSPLGAYIRAKLLNGTAAPRRAHRRPVKDDQALAQVLSRLGDSRLSSNLNQLARSANTGSLPVTAETLPGDHERLPGCPAHAGLPYGRARFTPGARGSVPR